MALDEHPGASSSGQIADHAALKTAYDARGLGPSLPAYTSRSTEAEHRAIHALLHAEHNQLGADGPLPTTLTGGQRHHLAHHAALHRAHNLRQREERQVHRGVNLSGAEFSAEAQRLPGVVDRDYRYPTAADLRHVASRGHLVVRLPVRWERLQPELLQALRVTEVERLTAVLDQAQRLGLKVLVDLHNYGRYIRPAAAGGGTLVLGDGRLTTGHLTDLWSRLASALVGGPGVLGYGLMNEPHDLPAVPGSTPDGTVVWDFDQGPGPWSGEADAVAAPSTTAGTVHDGRASLRVTRGLAAGPHQVIRVNDNARTALSDAAGRSLSAWVLVPADAPGGRWRAQLELQDRSYRWVAGPSVDLTPGRWARVTCTPDPDTWSGHRGVGVQFSSEQPRATAAQVYVDTVRQHGPPAGELTGAQQWEQASQACVDVIRGQRDRTPIYVSGVGHSGAHTWPQHHPAPWIHDPADAVVYEGHYYFDRDNSGTYRHRFADEEADARGRGYASLADRATSELGRFLDWCGAHDVRGFLGELGWANTEDAARWNAVGDRLYTALDDAGVGASYWAAGQWYGTAYNLSLYTGAPLSRSAGPAPVVEAHPSFEG